MFGGIRSAVLSIKESLCNSLGLPFSELLEMLVELSAGSGSSRPHRRPRRIPPRIAKPDPDYRCH